MAVGGTLPPMTEARADTIIDPRFTIGDGAFEECERRGLRCPVRGCGKYFHVLSRHLTEAHSDIGGKIAVCDALNIPRMTRLVSAWYTASRKFDWHALADDDPRKVGLRNAQQRVRELVMMGVYERRYPNKGMEQSGWRDFRNRCEEQMRKPIAALASRLKRPPTMKEVAKEVSEAFAWHLVSIYGNFGAGLKAMGLDAWKPGQSPERKKKATREYVLGALRAYYEAHKELPLPRQASNPSRLPLIPCRESIMKGMGVESYPAAMKLVAKELGITTGRYVEYDPTSWTEGRQSA